MQIEIVGSGAIGTNRLHDLMRLGPETRLVLDATATTAHRRG
jgi:hypothetical protein